MYESRPPERRRTRGGTFDSVLVLVFVLVLVLGLAGSRAGMTHALRGAMTHPEGGFENLRVWQYSRQLCREVYPLVLAAEGRRDHPLSQQLNRAALSIMANLAEGCLRRVRREFVPFLRIAAGSNAEVRALLYAVADREHVSIASVTPLIDRSNEIGRMLQGLLVSVQRSTDRKGPAQP